MPTWQAGVTVMLKPVVNDPQGLAVEGGLRQMGYGGVRGVRVGKYIELVLAAATESEARSQVEAMCDTLLANPVIEDYAYIIDEADTRGRGNDADDDDLAEDDTP